MPYELLAKWNSTTQACQSKQLLMDNKFQAQVKSHDGFSRGQVETLVGLLSSNKITRRQHYFLLLLHNQHCRMCLQAKKSSHRNANYSGLHMIIARLLGSGQACAAQCFLPYCRQRNPSAKVLKMKACLQATFSRGPTAIGCFGRMSGHFSHFVSIMYST